MISLKLFGGASLETEQGPLSGPAAQRHRLALLALLAASHPRALPREKLTAYLWPERDSENARNLLSQAVYTLRKALGEEAILAAGDELRFNPEVIACDVVRFEEARAAGERERAVGLYTGPFLDGFFLDDAPEFGQWMDAERERLARSYTELLEWLAETATNGGDAKDAVEWWRRRVAQEPYNARVTLRLMLALETAGDRAGALRQARIHAALLAQEFQAEPDPEVEALAERLRREPVASASAAEERVPQLQSTTAGGAGPEPARADGPAAAPASAVASASPAEAEPASLTASRQPLHPPAGRAHPGLSPWKRITVPAAALLGFVAVLSVGWLLPEMGARPGAATGAAPGPKAIAVLPCANLSRDPEEEYFSDGLTEELIGVLAQVRALQVVARTSAFVFKGENRDIREIGRALSAGTVLECSVRRSGERVRVTAQLIDAENGYHLWAETYEREGADVFAIQSDLALRIVRALEAELTPAERGRLVRRPTEDLEAYTLYLKGRFAWSQRGAGLATAIEYFEQAIEIDPHYARAYAGLASAYGPLGIHGHIHPREARERMRETALRAVELDDGLAEAHVALAAYLHVYEWDWTAAEREYRRAIELDPDHPTAHDWYGFLLDRMGRFDEAIAARHRAIALDPLTPNSGLAAALRLAGRYPEAKAAYEKVLERHPGYWQAYEGLGTLYAEAGDLEEAVRALEGAVAHAGRLPRPKAGLARVLALAGREAEARRLVEELRAEADSSEIYNPVVAAAFIALGDKDAAIGWLETAYRQRHPDLISLYVEPRYAGLRHDPRFQDLLRRIGFLL